MDHFSFRVGHLKEFHKTKHERTVLALYPANLQHTLEIGGTYIKVDIEMSTTTNFVCHCHLQRRAHLHISAIHSFTDLSYAIIIS